MPAADASDGEGGAGDTQHLSDRGDEQDDAAQRDSLAGTHTAVLLRALSDAVAEPSAFIQPSAHIADVARQVTKVGHATRWAVHLCGWMQVHDICLCH